MLFLVDMYNTSKFSTLNGNGISWKEQDGEKQGRIKSDVFNHTAQIERKPVWYSELWQIFNFTQLEKKGFLP